METRLAKFAGVHHWAIVPDLLPTMLAGAEKGAARGTIRQVKGGVAVIPLAGGIWPEDAEAVASMVEMAVADKGVGAVVLDIDSPGGSVYGVQEASARIFAARGTKPIIAVANAMAASAAYWLGTSADQLVVTPSGEVGSVGVFAAHLDVSKALDMGGMKVTLVSAGKYKVEANPFEPLAEEARAQIQTDVDRYYADFVGDVARNRGVSKSKVMSDYGEGRMYGAKEAVSRGMADRVGTLQDVIGRLIGRSQTASAAKSLARDMGIRTCRAKKSVVKS